MLDNLYDFDPPAILNKLKELEVGDDSLKFTFNHSTDNVGVSTYDIYQNGVYIQSEITKNDDKGLSYANQGVSSI